MPFLKAVVYPSKRNKGYIEQTIYIRDILWSWSQNSKRKRTKILIDSRANISVINSMLSLLTCSQEKAKPTEPENPQKMCHLNIKNQKKKSKIITSDLMFLMTNPPNEHKRKKHGKHYLVDKAFMFFSLFSDLNSLFRQHLLGLNRLFRQHLLRFRHFLHQKTKPTS